MYSLKFNNDEEFGNVIITDIGLYINVHVTTKVFTSEILRVYANDLLIGVLEPQENQMTVQKKFSKTSINAQALQMFNIKTSNLNSQTPEISNNTNETLEITNFYIGDELPFVHNIFNYKLIGKMFIK